LSKGGDGESSKRVTEESDGDKVAQFTHFGAEADCGTHCSAVKKGQKPILRLYGHAFMPITDRKKKKGERKREQGERFILWRATSGKGKCRGQGVKAAGILE